MKSREKSVYLRWTNFIGINFDKQFQFDTEMKCNCLLPLVCKERASLICRKVHRKVDEQKSGLYLSVVTLCLLLALCVKGSVLAVVTRPSKAQTRPL